MDAAADARTEDRAPGGRRDAGGGGHRAAFSFGPKADVTLENIPSMNLARSAMPDDLPDDLGQPAFAAQGRLARQKPALGQDPHRVRELSERNLETAIGREVRAFRRSRGMTVADLAAATGLSIGMLSKIENGITSPSLTTLQVLSHAFSAPITAFFRGFEERREVQHVKAGEHIEIERRGTRAGHQYHLLGHVGSNASGVVVEPYLITLTEQSDVFPTFQHDGIELLFMLEGEVTYRHGDRLFHLRPGDSLFFDADARHGPEVLDVLPARYLSVISYPQP